MEFKISTFTERSFSAVSLTRDPGTEGELFFPTGGYSTARPNTSVREDDEIGSHLDLFAEINQFLQTYLTEDQKDQLFVHYDRLAGIFVQSNPKDCNLDDLTKAITREVNGIYRVVKFDALREFIVTNPRIKLPQELRDDYVTNDKITPTYKALTYRLQEYIDLVAVALGLRLMIPVWGFYLPIAGKESTVNMKEFVSYQLIMNSAFYKIPAFTRLDVYVRANLKETTYDVNSALNFMSSEEIPTYLLALAVIRKLSIAPLSIERERDHLMKILYNYIDGRFERMATEFKQQVADKKSGGGPIEDNSSVWSMYKMKEAITKGELELIQLYVNEFHQAAVSIDPNYTPDRLMACILHIDTIEDFNPTRAQKGLAAWIMSTVIAGVVIDMFDMKALKNTMAIAQTILWDWGFLDLAMMLTARKDTSAITSELSKAKVSPAHRETLDVINPYTLPDPKRDENLFIPNSAVRGIEEIIREFMRNDWYIDSPKQLAYEYNRADLSEFLDISPSVRNRLAEVLIRLNDHVR